MTGARVAVTGDGAISALGATVAACMEALYAGTVQPPGLGGLETALSPAPPVFWVSAPIAPSSQRVLTRTSELALTALREALSFSWGGWPAVNPERIGVAMGTTVGCTFNDEEFYRDFRRGGSPDPFPIERFLKNDLASVVADHVGARGPVVTVANACASGTDAIGVAIGWLLAGRCDVVLAGGADELARFAYLGFNTLMNTAKERCRPFDLNRQGLNLGEGAAVVVLEREEDARRRGARVLGLIPAYASASDAYHPTAPHPEGRGLRKALAAALRAAGVGPPEIGFVNAHGTGTSENDRIEGRVLADVFSPEVVVFSTKGYTGHVTGAAGALEAVMTLRNLLDGRVPRSAGFETPDPDCVVVPTTAVRPVSARMAISTSLAFGGTNSVLVLEKGDPS